MRWANAIFLAAAVLAGCGDEQQDPAQTTESASPGLVEQAQERADAVWRDLKELELPEGLKPPALKAQAEQALEEAKRLLGEKNYEAAREAFEKAAQLGEQAKEAAQNALARLEEETYEAVVASRARAVALRKRLDEERTKLISRLAQEEDADEKDLLRQVARYADEEIFDDFLTDLDAKLEEAKAYAEDKRYESAREGLETVTGELEKLLGWLEAKEFELRVERAKELSRVWMEEAVRRGVAGSLLTGVATSLAAAERAEANSEWEEALANYEEAAKSASDAVKATVARKATAGELVGAKNSATKARNAWRVRLEELNLEPGEEGQLAETTLKLAEQLAAAGSLTESLEAYRKAEAQFRAAFESSRKRLDEQRAKFEEHLAKQGSGNPPDPSGRFAARSGAKMVLSALEWLAKHQDEDGLWDCDRFMKHDPADDQCDGPGLAQHDVGVSALALECFLRSGYRYLGEGDRLYHGLQVWRGVEYLVGMQGASGVFGNPRERDAAYHHAMATGAICLAYKVTGDQRLRAPAQAAVQVLVDAQTPGRGWGYKIQDPQNDTCHTFWAFRALSIARDSGLEVGPEPFEGAAEWIDKMTDPNFGQVGYQYPGGALARPEGMQDRFPPEKSQSMTGAGIWIRLDLIGREPKYMRTPPDIKEGISLCMDLLPEWNPENGAIDMHYWLTGSGAIARLSTSSFRRQKREWNGALAAALSRSQHNSGSGSRSGSWDPLGPWGSEGGRVYSTAICALALLETREPERKKK